VSTPPPSDADADVAIAGAGPVGMLLALLLGRRGWRVEVLKRDTVLIRPDSYLFGTAAGPGAAAGLVDALRAALAGGGP